MSKLEFLQDIKETAPLKGSWVPKVERGDGLASAPDPHGHGRRKLSRGLFPRFALPQAHASTCKDAPSVLDPHPPLIPFRYPANGSGLRSNALDVPPHCSGAPHFSSPSLLAAYRQEIQYCLSFLTVSSKPKRNHRPEGPGLWPSNEAMTFFSNFLPLIDKMGFIMVIINNDCVSLFGNPLKSLRVNWLS